MRAIYCGGRSKSSHRLQFRTSVSQSPARIVKAAPASELISIEPASLAHTLYWTFRGVPKARWRHYLAPQSPIRLRLSSQYRPPKKITATTRSQHHDPDLLILLREPPPTSASQVYHLSRARPRVHASTRLRKLQVQRVERRILSSTRRRRVIHATRTHIAARQSPHSHTPPHPKRKQAQKDLQGLCTTDHKTALCSSVSAASLSRLRPLDRSRSDTAATAQCPAEGVHQP